MIKNSWLLVSLCLIGTGLRFHALDRQSLWDDEMSTLRTISTPRPQFVQRFATYETHPPLYFLQLKLWRALHFRSLVKLRANSALWGSLGLILAYLAGRLYGGEALGLLTLAFLALSPYHLAYSQEMRPYAMAIALALAALLALERRSWILLGVFWTALLYTHYWGAFVVLAQVVYGCMKCHPPRFLAGDPWIPPQRPGGMTPILICAGISAAVFSLWLPVLFQQMGVVDRLVFWVSGFSFANLAKVFLAYGGLVFNMASSVFYLPAKVWMMAALGLAFAAALALGMRRGPRAAVCWLVIGLGVPWVMSYWKPTMYVWYRFPVLMLPAFVLLVAAGLLSIRGSALRVLLAAVCLSSYAWGDWIYFHRWQKANPKAVVAYIHHLRKSGTIVIRPFYFADLFNFYDQGTTTVVDEHLLDAPEKRAALRGKNVIFVAFDVASDPVGDALISEFKPSSALYFPGTAHLGITVYELTSSDRHPPR